MTDKLPLHLYPVLVALVEDAHVSRAADRLYLTQPALSNPLSRLRELMEYPVLERRGRTMVPTDQAKQKPPPRCYGMACGQPPRRYRFG